MWTIYTHLVVLSNPLPGSNDIGTSVFLCCHHFSPQVAYPCNPEIGDVWNCAPVHHGFWKRDFEWSGWISSSIIGPNGETHQWGAAATNTTPRFRPNNNKNTNKKLHPLRDTRRVTLSSWRKPTQGQYFGDGWWDIKSENYSKDTATA